MTYLLLKQESSYENIIRLAKELINDMIQVIENSDINEDETVHTVRKRCKMMRGFLRLFSPHFVQYEYENSYFRDMARELSHLRDSQALLDVFEDLSKSCDAKKELAHIKNRLLSTYHDQAKSKKKILEDIRQRAYDSLKRVEHWGVLINEDIWVNGFLKNYLSAKRSMKKCFKQKSSHHYHEWRKRVKYYWYHARLLEGLDEEFFSPLRKKSDELSDNLGTLHDIDVLFEYLDAHFHVDDIKNFYTYLLYYKEGLKSDIDNQGKELFSIDEERIAYNIRSHPTHI